MLSNNLSQISNILVNAKISEQWMGKPSDMGIHLAFLIDEYSKNRVVILQARKIVKQCNGNEGCESKQIYDWVKNSVNYTPDPSNYERIITPDIAIRNINLYGQFNEDCDSITVLLGSLLKAAGIPVKIIMVKTSGDNNYNHVYAKALIMNDDNKAEFVSLDATYKNNTYGWEYPSNNKIEIGRIRG